LIFRKPLIIFQKFSEISGDFRNFQKFSEIKISLNFLGLSKTPYIFLKFTEKISGVLGIFRRFQEFYKFSGFLNIPEYY
jgi:hypothetical protein